MAGKTRVVRVREIRGRKEIRGKVYEYTYYTLPLNIYVRKSVVERWGPEFIVETDPDKGIVVVKPKKLVEEQESHS